MSGGIVFSWAENAEGRMVHVDSVPRGVLCGCTCPHCQEKLLARHGEEREHGFAHHSETRGANLKICYMVILYKLAEQIVQTRKRIHTPSYYGIFRESDIEFVNVKIDSSYEREDKQPDVIATTKEGKQYLIEFVFRYKVQHKHAIDYKNLTCLEIDLSGQTLETVEDFLLSSNEDRKWLNNEDYFEKIESRYKNAGKQVRVVEASECRQCELRNNCCAVRSFDKIIFIENSGHTYRICKTALFNETLEENRQRIQREKQERKALSEWRKKASCQPKKIEPARQEELSRSYFRRKEFDKTEMNVPDDTEERTCFNCKANLAWANRGDGYANCGCYSSVGVPKRTPPDCAKTCRNYHRKT